MSKRKRAELKVSAQNKARTSGSRTQGSEKSRVAVAKTSRQGEVSKCEDSLYNHPDWYDILFSEDSEEEMAFLLALFDRYVQKPVKSVFEPACGTGRLLLRMSQKGLNVSGIDLNPHAVEYCNKLFRRKKNKSPAFVADMTDFELPAPVDAAFNTINSFRHLLTEQAALAHLHCMAKAVRPGGIYALGLHLLPTLTPPLQSESYRARRGDVEIRSRLKSVELNKRQRMERCEMKLFVNSGGKRVELRDELLFRTYTLPQMRRLLLGAPQWKVEQTFDFGYEIDKPIKLNGATQDVVFVLRRQPN